MTPHTSRRGFSFTHLLVLISVSALTLTGAGRAAPPPSHYPLELDVAIGNAYTGKLAGIQRSCTVWLNGGRDEYALAVVLVRGGHTDLAGFQFINTAGWFNMWRSHAATAGVPAGQRASVARLVRELATRCGARWTP